MILQGQFYSMFAYTRQKQDPPSRRTGWQMIELTDQQLATLLVFAGGSLFALAMEYEETGEIPFARWIKNRLF
jgi:hypothetical protein